jgi:hypothetical protein
LAKNLWGSSLATKLLKSCAFGDLFSIPRNQPKFKKDRQISIHGSHWVAKNIEGYFSPKKLLSYLACSQIWRNLLVDHHQFWLQTQQN